MPFERHRYGIMRQCNPFLYISPMVRFSTTVTENEQKQPVINYMHIFDNVKKIHHFFTVYVKTRQIPYTHEMGLSQYNWKLFSKKKN